MAEVIRTLLTMSIIGSGAALVLFALKPLLINHVSKTAQYYMWIIPVLILLTLVRITLPIAGTLSKTLNIPNLRNVVEENILTTNEIIEREYAQGTTPSTEAVIWAKQNSPFSIWLYAAMILWPVGVMIFLLRTLAAYLHLTKCLRDELKPFDYAISHRVKVYTHPAFPTPMLMGLFRPRIILPEREYQSDELKNILLHELTHYRRHDVALKWIVVVANALHWFNPVVYILRREFNQACELSCDEAVIRKLDGAAKQSYGDTLISVVSENRYPISVTSVTMCEDKKKLKERLVAIMNYKKKTKSTLLITAFLTVMITSSAFAFGAQWSEYSFWKLSHSTIQLPDQKIFDISAADMEALILSKMNNPKTDIFIYSSSPIVLETDYSLRFTFFEVLISESDKDGNFVRRVYQIGLSSENKTMTITHRDYTELVNSDFNYCRFSDFWNALSLLPTGAINETIQKDTPNFLSLRYTTHDVYANSSPKIEHIFYNAEGMINGYREAPSVMFNFTPMYQDENDPNSSEGIGMVILYYYTPSP